MTKDELVQWVAGHFFCSWEIERAQEIAVRDGYRQAIEYLAEGNLGKGLLGPGIPTFFKRGKGLVQCYYPETDFVVEPPDLEIPLMTLAKLVLDDPQQPRLL